MRTQLPRKVFFVSGAVLIGIAICVSMWLFLREHKKQVFQKDSTTTTHSNRGVTKSGNTLQPSKNPHGNLGEAQLSFEGSIARGAKSNFMSMLSEDELANPDMQKYLKAMDSPEAIEWTKDMMENGGPSYRKWFDVLESQGIPVDREVFSKLFYKVFPTGEPEDYEPEMRLELAKLFLDAKPVDPQDPMKAQQQRLNVYYDFMKQDERNFAWMAGQFDADWMGIPGTESNPAIEWMTDVQRNAASIVAAAETTSVDTPEVQQEAPSWDMSSVMESPSTFDSETEVPTTPDTSGSAPMTDAEIEAAIEKSLTSQPPDTPTATSQDTPSEIQSNLETTLKAQFSSERFKRAMDTLDKYGPEEGLRRLRENDPEVASQIERHRNRSRSSSVPRIPTSRDLPRSIGEDSDKSEEEVSR